MAAHRFTKGELNVHHWSIALLCKPSDPDTKFRMCEGGAIVSLDSLCNNKSYDINYVVRRQKTEIRPGFGKLACACGKKHGSSNCGCETGCSAPGSTGCGCH